MKQFKLNEQIAFLRKAKGITQEELAQALGVTNQAVSKWESALCCPDIQLLPDIAAYFDVSIDQLIGYQGVDTSDNLPLQLRAAIDNARAGDDANLARRLAYTIHATLFSKEMQSAENLGWNFDDVISHAGKAEWGLSCISHPNITMCMRYGSVFFSDNRINLRNDNVSILCDLMRSLSTIVSMKALWKWIMPLEYQKGFKHAWFDIMRADKRFDSLFERLNKCVIYRALPTDLSI